MKTLTWKDFDKFIPKYDPLKERLDWDGTILDLLNHPKIPDEDKIWAFTRKGIVSDKTLRLFAVACAREVQHLMKYESSFIALEVAEALAYGKATEEKLKEAKDAAFEGSKVATKAEAITRNAWAELAALSVTTRDAWQAAEGAADAARWASLSRETARAKQVQIAIELINKHEQ